MPFGAWDARAMRSRRNILGIDVLAATHADAVRTLDEYINTNATPLVTFLNANVSNIAAKDPSLKRALDRSLVLNDGIGIGLASRLLYGSDFPDNLQGTDFVPEYLKETSRVFRIFALGGIPSVAERAAEVLKDAAPQHEYVGSHHGFFDPKEIATLQSIIRDSDANLILIGMGTPYQEKLADRLAGTFNGVSIICVGGLFDFLSNNRPRAPLWMRQLRCEWLFRLAIEPRRLWRRYLIGNVIFMARLASAYGRER
ncbi:WecB/TagA/CpsF family glycosyltransferase [Rhodopseudomonas sp. HC1]|uniref:WecB/TagA/CpsF family glycosyltransferase n=1 Tax=Rhodopseudomonas infernalis TaxID=2897386 RepID=UPI001EE8620E|nr:WecB/TagA/CpsF family glycosyltransferase [Rhodopseudomonas infernalis]MCG6203118.1 WecB/TagA/CpsF family glycosyltransferase [Rhodopseudomonas infernalis]